MNNRVVVLGSSTFLFPWKLFLRFGTYTRAHAMCERVLCTTSQVTIRQYTTQPFYKNPKILFDVCIKLKVFTNFIFMVKVSPTMCMWTGSHVIGWFAFESKLKFLTFSSYVKGCEKLEFFSNIFEFVYRGPTVKLHSATRNCAPQNVWMIPIFVKMFTFKRIQFFLYKFIIIELVIGQPGGLV